MQGDASMQGDGPMRWAIRALDWAAAAGCLVWAARVWDHGLGPGSGWVWLAAGLIGCVLAALDVSRRAERAVFRALLVKRRRT